MVSCIILLFLCLPRIKQIPVFHIEWLQINPFCIMDTPVTEHCEHSFGVMFFRIILWQICPAPAKMDFQHRSILYLIEEALPLHRLKIEQQPQQEKFLRLLAYFLLIVNWNTTIYECFFIVIHRSLWTICIVLNSSICDLCHLVSPKVIGLLIRSFSRLLRLPWEMNVPFRVGLLAS